MLDNLENLCTDAIANLENFKDYLKNYSNYNMIKVEEKIKKAVYNNNNYDVPVSFEVIAVHCTNPAGWDMM